MLSHNIVKFCFFEIDLKIVARKPYKNTVENGMHRKSVF